jgi:hypothetical protein
MPVRLQETILAFGKKQQGLINHPNASAELWRLNKINRDLVSGTLNTEDDADELGRGNEFIENVYPISRDAAFTLEKYLSSQWAAWVFTFAFGSFQRSGQADPYTYVCKPLDPLVGMELPYFTYVEEVRAGASPIVSNVTMIGCAVAGFQLEVVNGVGRAASKLSANIMGSGNVILTAHGYTIPGATPETLLPASSLSLVSLSTTYGTLKQTLAFRMGWDNGISDDVAYFPGSGTGSLGEAFRGRLLACKRVATPSFEAFVEPGSVEDTALAEGTTGTLTAVVSNGANDELTILFHKVRYSRVEKSDGPGGLVKVAVTCAPMWDTTGEPDAGLVTATIKTDTTDICLAHA